MVFDMTEQVVDIAQKCRLMWTVHLRETERKVMYLRHILRQCRTQTHTDTLARAHTPYKLTRGIASVCTHACVHKYITACMCACVHAHVRVSLGRVVRLS